MECIKCTNKHHEGERFLAYSDFMPSCITKYGATCKVCKKRDLQRYYQKNKAKHLEKCKNYYEANKEKLLQYHNEYYQSNKEELVQKVMQYAKNNPDVNREASKRYRERNKEQRAISTKKWRDANKGLTCFLANKRRAQKLKATPSWYKIEEPQIQALYDEAERLTLETGIPHEVDHIVPLQSDLVCGLHCLANLRVVTKKENNCKSNKLDYDLIELIK